MRKKVNFLAKKIQEIQEISQHNLLVLLNFYVIFFGNFLEIQEIFLIFDQIFKFIAFLCNNFFRNLRFEAKFQKFSLLTMLFKCLFILHQFLVFLACFSCEKFLVIKFLDFLFLMRNCDAYSEGNENKEKHKKIF